MLGNPCMRAPALGPRWMRPLRAPGMASLRFERDAVVFRQSYDVDIHHKSSFGARFGGPHARCLRFVTTVARVLLTATQDSLPAGGPRPCRSGLSPAGHFERFLLLPASSFPSHEVRRDLFLAQKTRDSRLPLHAGFDRKAVDIGGKGALAAAYRLLLRIGEQLLL